jgi:hypothetical protein
MVRCLQLLTCIEVKGANFSKFQGVLRFALQILKELKTQPTRVGTKNTGRNGVFLLACAALEFQESPSQN